ncbi:hypothetical protein ACIQOW_03210 [Kitasatospora sp. NPDC091335]
MRHGGGAALGVGYAPIAVPRLVHRTELVHGSLPEGPAALLALLLERSRA